MYLLVIIRKMRKQTLLKSSKMFDPAINRKYKIVMYLQLNVSGRPITGC
jgi:hypothetical protein